MSGKADYTAGEWALLSELPLKVAIGSSVVQADEGLAGGDREMLAAMKELAAAEERLPGNELIQAVLLELKEEPGEEGTPREITIAGGAAWTSLIDELLERSRQASDLLASKAAPHEAVEFRQWLLDIAKEAVLAAESGGFLGIGGERVTDQEQTFLAELGSALGLSG